MSRSRVWRLTALAGGGRVGVLSSSLSLCRPHHRHHSSSSAAYSPFSTLFPPRSPASPSLLLTAEHASCALPPNYEWPPEDRRLEGTHWTYDPGAREFCAELGERTGAPSIYAEFSRLLVDPNRELSSDTLFRLDAEHEPIALNRSLCDQECQSRLDLCYHPFHRALSALVRKEQPKCIVSVHSFTPVYEGQQRTVEIGVLFSRESDRWLSEKVTSRLRSNGFPRTELNSPWSGLAGFMNSCQCHSETVGATGMMLELRQDLVGSVEWRSQVIDLLVPVLEEHFGST
eukprot:CAMPEP_0174230730 /NCGR_PEP_ID=MMETSP0417-20130205/1433_1 /TAXON_ID=242541 /ORGANISM="Mayorella sp, Strain BSH-02190019" /LENGTH=286 /DNA_ID=CAMNT_0015308485 /DNA_START=21 /DNA_END=881 /DNA_ORIENTATION=-